MKVKPFIPFETFNRSGTSVIIHWDNSIVLSSPLPQFKMGFLNFGLYKHLNSGGQIKVLNDAIVEGNNASLLSSNLSIF